MPLRVVTGSPGVGKSALLGVLICAAHPVLREPTEAIWHHVDRWPQRNPDLVAVHARQRSFDDIVGSLRRQLGIDGSGLVDLVAARSRQPTLVVDALDEAADPARIVSELLLPLAAASRPDGRPACRLLVAMRPWKEFDHLRAAAEAAGGLIDLDYVPLTQVRYDLENYVSDLVRCHPPYDEVAYAGARQTFAAAVATALTGGSLSGGGQEPGAVAGRKAWGEFLVAGLYAHHLVTAHGPISDVGDAKELGWRAPRTLPELLEIDLAARTGSHWLRPLLAALAHTRGDGMPARVAGHLSVVFTGLKTAGGGPARHEVAEALKAARFYLRQTTDVDGTTLYRLFHQGLADYLVEHPVERTRRDRIDPRAVLAALVAPLESADGSGRRWDVAEPYLLRHAVQHAADAGLVGELVADPEFLVYADPAYVAPLLDASARPPLSAAEYTALVGRSSQSRRQLLALYAARQHDHRTAYRLANPPGQPALPWQPLWSTAGADREISAIACAAGPEVVATGDAAGSIVLHDRYRGTALLPPLAGHEAPIDGLAFGTVGGVLALLSSDVEGRFRLWDGTTGRCLHIAWAGRPAPCTSLELLTFAGRVFVAAGNADQVILTDLVTGEDAHLPGGSSGEMAIMDGRLVSLAGAATDGGSTFTLGGSTFAVDGSSSTLDGAAEPELVVWDAASRQLVAAIPMPAPVERVATTPAGDILVLTGGQALLLGHKTAEPEPPSAPSDAPEQAEPAAAEPEPEERFVGRHAVPDAPPADGSQASHDEIMNAFFGSKSQGPRERTRPGADAILRLELDLHETVFGVEVPITVDTAVLCTTCAGAGAAPGTQLVSCDRCDGRGEVQSVQRSFLGQIVTPRRCTACEGYGTVIPHRCATCGGDGRVRTRRTLTVKVPPGVEDGTRVRLAQQGEVGPGGGTAGDLYVEIHERPHDVFSRKGDDLHCRVMLPTTAAALGTRLTIETLDGEKKIDVKPGTQPGAQLRLRGFGAHHLRGTGRGDLYVHLDARTPAKLNKVERELMERFQRLRPDLGSVEVVSEAAPGSDLELVATVPMALAALGAKLTLPTKDGPRQVDVPAGAQPGLTLRLKRVRLGAGTPADANVRVRVTVPSHLTPAQEAVLRDFSALRGEAPTTQVEDGFFTKMRKAFNGEL
ncbi:hypothetical protein Phou_013600 [Phytohabitans houttuyneae]|uniref:Chaperone protein DnaJ n=1 Tax=Phytohabitans houttuyneae TaxID=1076126 RepID=A0A6V8K0T2_9ACTN|nr:hypothetical protein Phou_013600 [Phytohabitans houttuyneae]